MVKKKWFRIILVTGSIHMLLVTIILGLVICAIIIDVKMKHPVPKNKWRITDKPRYETLIAAYSISLRLQTLNCEETCVFIPFSLSPVCFAVYLRQKSGGFRHEESFKRKFRNRNSTYCPGRCAQRPRIP